MRKADKEALASLGLEVDDAPRDVDLNLGVVLTIRPPESVDWAKARSRVARVVESRDAIVKAVEAYGWSIADIRDVIEDSETWEIAFAHMLYSELAVEIVTAIRSPTGAVTPAREVIAPLLRLEGNLTLFRQSVDAASEGLIRAKKE
ncbi:hypothetical protein OVA11_19030 [Caulobacter sp. SL161]|uniref:hypothetical protein n=1 Tax=Caulobacter sp. SL161 TaxID=2995156 RepID=UPI0022745E3A|nr:hypothetical protein [Caulobacter sp. SL161]MCY1649072.1 hypothetical protein [Caulobacter sp. SL161]